jgi:hypothetical protein
VWQRLHELLLAEMRGAGLLDLSRAALDSNHLRAMKGGHATGPSPVDRRKTKYAPYKSPHASPDAAPTTAPD